MLIILILNKGYVGRDIYGMWDDWSFKRKVAQTNYGASWLWGNPKGQPASRWVSCRVL